MGLDGEDKSVKHVKERVEKLKEEWKFVSEGADCELMNLKIDHLGHKMLHYLGLNKFEHYY